MPPNPYLRLGLVVAVVTAILDQGSKLWLLYGFDLAARVPVRLTPFLDLVLAWNKGISYGLFQLDGATWKAVLLIFTAAAVALLSVWLSRVGSRLTALSLGLIMGGAVGNAVDRLLHNAVVDFVLFHITTETINFNWYVFNLADAAIVAGVAGLLYDAARGSRAAKAPRSST